MVLVRHVGMCWQEQVRDHPSYAFVAGCNFPLCPAGHRARILAPPP